MGILDTCLLYTSIALYIRPLLFIHCRSSWLHGYLIQSDVLSAIFIEAVFITMWSLELFKHLTLTGVFCFPLTCHRGLKYLEHVNRLLHSWPLFSAAGLTISEMAVQGQAPAFSACLVQKRSHSRLKLFISSNGSKTIYASYSIHPIFWWK